MKPFRILHISDVHFGTSFSPPLWQYVTAIAKKTEPDLIACTGDLVDHGGIFKLASARRELEELAKQASRTCLVRVVPGNHDVAILGNFRLYRRNRAFEAIFDPGGIPLPCDLPRYTVYRAGGLLRRSGQWTKFTSILYWRGIKYWWQHRGKHLPITRVDDPKEVFLAYLDSNAELTAATGRVGLAALTDLQSAMTNLAADNTKRFFVPRILLLHHHPAPIAYSDVNESLTSFEPFLMLRNAGTVVRELARHDFDVVLHGHKHYAGFCRLGFGLIDGPECEVAVLSAGSAGLVETGAGRNSVNLVDVYPNGQLRFHQLAFGSGQSLTTSDIERNSRLLHSIRTQKNRCFFRAAQKVKQQCESIERHLEIDEQGAAHIRFRCENVKVLEGPPVRAKAIRAQVSVGLIDPDGVLLDPPSLEAGYAFSKRTKVPSRVFIGDLDFGQQVSQVTTEISYGYTYTTLGTFALTNWESLELHRQAERAKQPEINPPGRNSFNLLIRVPTERAKMTLILPSTLQEPQVRVRVSRASSFPQSLLAPDADFDMHYETWDVDAVMTEYEGKNLRQLDLHRWSLEIERPLPGYRYEMSWLVNSREEQPSLQMAARALGHRRRLLQASNTEVGEATMVSLLTEVAHFLKEEFGAKSELDECLAVALFVYDSEKQGLDLAAEGVFQGPPTADKPHFPLGVGVPGIAFKRRRPTSYLSPKITGTSGDGMYLYRPGMAADEGPDFNVVLAFPVFPPEVITLEAQGEQRVRPPRETIGVMSIATTAFDSKFTEVILTSNALRGSTTAASDTGTRALREIWALLDSCLGAIVDAIGEQDECAPKP